MTRNCLDTRKTDIAYLTEFLALFDVRDMHLDRGHSYRLHRIQKCDARMRICTGVYYYSVGILVCALYLIYKVSLVVRLISLDLDALFFAVALYLFDKIRIRLATVVHRLSYAEHIKVWPVYNKKLHFVFSILFFEI